MSEPAASFPPGFENEVDQRGYGPVAFNGMSKWTVDFDRIVVASPLSLRVNITGFFEVRDDSLNRPQSDSYFESQIPHQDSGGPDNAKQNVGVVCQKSPLLTTFGGAGGDHGCSSEAILSINLNDTLTYEMEFVNCEFEHLSGIAGNAEMKSVSQK